MGGKEGTHMIKHTLLTSAAAVITYACVQLYPTAGVITAADTDTATVTTVHGHTYAITNTDCDYYIGDAVALIMTDNGTPDGADDAVIMARYIGGADALYHLGD